MKKRTRSSMPTVPVRRRDPSGCPRHGGAPVLLFLPHPHVVGERVISRARASSKPGDDPGEVALRRNHQQNGRSLMPHDTSTK